jgi:hypothetical protein
MNISRTSKTSRIFPTLIGIAIAIAAPSSTSAAKSTKVDFGPYQVLGYQAADCGSFQVLNDYTVAGHFISHFAKNGSLKFITQHIEYSDSTYYNSNFQNILLHGGPGELENDRFDFNGDPAGWAQAVNGFFFRIIIPGQGVIFHQGGRTIYDWFTGTVLFQAGPNDWAENDIAALCAALTS